MRGLSLSIELAAIFLFAAGVPAHGASQVCRSCHAAIYDSYMATPMAHSARKLDAAAVPERLDGASFEHAPSGYRYRVQVRNGNYVLEFENIANGAGASKVLAFAVGSGTRAFSYLISDDGFLYEAPVAYYTRGHSWGLPPGYDRYSYPFLTRPVTPPCLSCHASFLQVQPLTLNRYAAVPFLEGGVACERCHGNGDRHVAKMQSANPAGDPEILNPAALPPAERDSICAQCHLNGDVRVMRPGADWRSYQPGGLLSDDQTVFVRAGKPGEMTVNGHVESLASSQCRRQSGGRLWCGSCHDPHFVPPPAQAAAWFRARCLACHAVNGCSLAAAARAKTHDDCIGCHMPKTPAADAQHTVFTDHSIPRRPVVRHSPVSASDRALVPFDGAPSTPRDLGLAYAIPAIGKTGGADRQRALPLLVQAAKKSPDDVEVLVSLAEIYRNDGKNALAEPLYQRALALDAAQVTARVGLGGILMERGQYAAAARLWKEALDKNNGLQLVRLNLALALWKTGRGAEARANLQRAMDINPAFTPPRGLLEELARAAREAR